jgi:hypothetical protein
VARPLFEFAILVAISLAGIRGSVAWQTSRVTTSGLTQKKWVAASTTAMSITGDIKISPDRLSMVGRDYRLTLVRDIDAEHLSDAGKIVDATKPDRARLYRTIIPAQAKFVNGNTICGHKNANWLLAVTQNEHSLSLAFFPGDGEPNLATASTSTELCATFEYFR